ncbi:hypothetical protein, partial [Roseateles sp.]|uniref:hypothetical protein n=1 Tax=Roseateles sp. TaxID=1971397 RepID=UPI002F411744
DGLAQAGLQRRGAIGQVLMDLLGLVRRRDGAAAEGDTCRDPGRDPGRHPGEGREALRDGGAPHWRAPSGR